MVTCVLARIESACISLLSVLRTFRLAPATSLFASGEKLTAWSARAAAACVLFPAALMAQVSVTPSTLNWVSVQVGQTGAQKVVTLTNSGSAAITISSITLGGTNPAD